MAQGLKVPPTKQRALIFQGGGSLAAYEAGVFSTLAERILKEERDPTKNLFDVIAGVSSGAINAAILTSYILKRKRSGMTALDSWRGAGDQLLTFWRSLSESFLDQNPFFEYLWNQFWNACGKWQEFWNSFGIAKNISVPSPESARRYYAARQISLFGASNVFTPVPYWDFKYWDNLMNFRFRFDSTPLRHSIKDFIKDFLDFPIQSHFKDDEPNEPRLLIGAVDVQSGDFVTFDSYDTKSVYEVDDDRDGKNPPRQVRIEYDTGIQMDHVMASTTLPINLEYTTLIDKNTDEPRTFWDGALINNTPLKELTTQHRLFWLHPTKEQQDWLHPTEEQQDWLHPTPIKKVLLHSTPIEQGVVKSFGIMNQLAKEIPELEIFIVDLWPTRLKSKSVPTDNDFIMDRLWDLIYHDKTRSDEKMTKLVTDYIEIIRGLVAAVEQNVPAPEKEKILSEFKKILSDPAIGQNITAPPGTPQKTRMELVYDRFKIKTVFRVELTDDGNTIANKFGDYSKKTIESLIKRGKKDASDKWIERNEKNIEVSKKQNS